MTRSIGFVTTDWARFAGRERQLGGAGHYRIGLPASWLRDYGWDVEVGEIGALTGAKGSRAITVIRADGSYVSPPPDLIVMQRCMHGLATNAQGEEVSPAVLIREARAIGQVIVNDLDDWFFGLDPRNQASRTTSRYDKLRTEEQRAAYNREHYAASIEASSAVTVSTPGLARLMQERFPKARIVVVRNAIDLARWTPRGTSDVEPVVGWVGATQWRSGDLQTTQAQAVGAFCNDERLTFHHSGFLSMSPAELRAAKRDTIASKYWVGSAGEQLGVERWAVSPLATIVDYPALFWPIDVGIVPLNDVPFNHSKSAIKLMEYAASGIPAVAQALPEQRWACDEVGLGRHARSPKDWRRELVALLDSGRRRDLAESARAAVKVLDIAQRGDAWREVYDRLLT